MKFCIIGSSRFKAQILLLKEALSLRGHEAIVAPDWPHDADERQTPEERADGRSRMYHNIDQCDEVWVMDRAGYVGWATHAGMKYATNKGRKVVRLKSKTNEQICAKYLFGFCNNGY
jgi:hypothetical protein